MEIILNGEPYSLKNAATIAQLIAELALDVRKIAVEKNLEIIPKSIYENSFVNAGDRIEIVNFIGGG